MMDARRAIPAVDRLLASEPFTVLAATTPRALLLAGTQAVLDEVRAGLADGSVSEVGHDAAWYADRVGAWLAAAKRPSLRRAVNATGVVLHTNLGRAPLAERAREAVEQAALGYTNLEYDLVTGQRGSRYDHCASLLRELTGAEAALVVNNNAAALVLALNTLAAEREAVVSRGELVEIGGSFRIPEIMARSGARLVEVGTTNRTHATDYRAELGPATGAVLKVHRSNFRVSGFTAEVPLPELARICADAGVPLIDDLGSGLLLEPATLGLPADEPTAGDALRAGADLVTMSGDKLLGGPQAGIVLGRREFVDRLRRNPLCRAFRVDKLTLAALEATLALYRDPDQARREIPVLRMLTLPRDEVRARADRLAEALRSAGAEADLRDGGSAVGGGAYPEVEIPTVLIAVRIDGSSPDELARRLRAAEPPVVVRIVDDRVALDLRTVLPEEEPGLVAAIAGARA